MFKLCGSDLRSFKEKLQRVPVFIRVDVDRRTVFRLSVLALKLLTNPNSVRESGRLEHDEVISEVVACFLSLLRFIPTNCTSYFQFLFDASHFISQIKAGTLSHVSRLYFNVKLLA